MQDSYELLRDKIYEIFLKHGFDIDRLWFDKDRSIKYRFHMHFFLEFDNEKRILKELKKNFIVNIKKETIFHNKSFSIKLDLIKNTDLYRSVNSVNKFSL